METHVVKKYSNRKLYDTRSKKYVTLDVIAELLRRGDAVRVVDRTSGDDITAVTLSQILLDIERRRHGPVPEPLLVDTVKERGEQLLAMLRTSLALPRQTIRRAADDLHTGAGRLERGVDEALSNGLRNLGIAPADEVAELRRQVDELSGRVEALGEQLRRTAGARRGADG